MFGIGDLIVHPMHGAGVVDDVVQEKVAGSTKEYYVFKMPVGGLVLKIPIANSQAIGIRAIISPAEAEALFANIPALEVEVNSNWNKRYQENLMRLKSDDGLSTGERKMLHNAKQIIISEIALVEGGNYQEVEARLDRAVMQPPPS